MERRELKYVLTLVLVVTSLISKAQSVGNYAVTRSTGNTYSSIAATGNSFAGWRYSGAFSEDDNRSIATDIGFDFWYNGTRYTQFSVSTNGFMDFSSSTDDGGPQCDDYGYCNFNFSSSNVNNGTWLALAPFYDDMTTAGGIDPLGTSIKYQLSGSAPNRVLTVEWVGMAVYQNTSPDLNFQVKLYESSGLIEYWYGTMNNGTNTFSYTVGINATSISNPPGVAELLTQQAANSASFGNSPQNNLSAMPVAGSKLTFTPLTPANPSGSLTFSAITNTGMTLNWADWASNEVGYVLYYSLDDINYFFQSQVGANITTATITGLIPSTTYYWRLFAVTEGTLSNPLSGDATTAAPGTVTSIADGRWDRTGTWDCGCIPTAADNVIVNDNVRIRSVADANDLTINNGGIVRFVRNTDRVLTINGNLLINSGAQFFVDASSSALHTVNLRGNLTNNGSVNLQADANSQADVYFIGQLGDQVLSGSGLTNTYNALYLDKAVKSNSVEVVNSVFSCNPEGLYFISGGTFNFKSPGTNNITIFNTLRAIPTNGKVVMNSANSSLGFSAGLLLQGDIEIINGIVNIGDGTDENLTVNGGQIKIDGGALNIAGRLDRSTTESAINYSQTNGVLSLPTVGSTSTTLAPFMMDVTGSTFDWSGGTIVLEREGGTGAQDLGMITTGASLGNVSGGILRIGNVNTPVGQTMELEMGTPIGRLELNSANATASLVGNDLTVLTNVDLLAGILLDNGNNISLGGDWINTSGTFTGTALVDFNGGNQSILSGTTEFSNLNLAGSAVKTIEDNLVVSGNLTIASTLALGTSGLQITLGGNWLNNGSFNRSNETLLLDGAIAQSIGGSSLNEFSNITVNKAGGNVIVDANLNLFGTLTISSASSVDLDGSGGAVFRLVSTATDDARIAELATGASLTGNMLFEKYFSGTGFKYWRHIGAPVTGSTVLDIQAEIPISGTFTGNDNGTGVIPINAFPSLYYYDPASGLPSETLDDRWVVYPSTTNTELLTTLGNESRGYAIWVRDTGPVTFDLTGEANFGTINYNLAGANEGWNLLGNPYPSDIDWDNSGWTKTDIQGGAIHVWNGTQYLTWNGSIGSLGNGRIAKGQGFWIQSSSASPQLVSTEAVKTATSATTYRTMSEESLMPVIEITLTDGQDQDKAYVQFDPRGSAGFDSYDAGKLSNSIFNLSTLSADSVPLSINIRNLEFCDISIPLKITNTEMGSYALRVAYPEVLSTSFEIFLHDRFTDSFLSVSEINGLYNFTINEDASTQNVDRFQLSLKPRSLNPVLSFDIMQNCEDNAVQVAIDATQILTRYEVYLNNILDTVLIGSGGPIAHHLKNMPSAGKNEVKIKAIESGCQSESLVFDHTFSYVVEPEIKLDDTTGKLYTSNGQAGYWYFNTELLSDDPAVSIMPNEISGGIYLVEVTNGACTYRSSEYLVTSLEDELASQMLEVWPIPTNDELKINFEKVIDRVVISDTSGRIYLSSENANDAINVRTMENGLYVITVFSGGEQYSTRFIKN